MLQQTCPSGNLQSISDEQEHRLKRSAILSAADVIAGSVHWVDWQQRISILASQNKDHQSDKEELKSFSRLERV